MHRDTNADLITCKWLLKFLIRAGQNAAVQYTRHWYTVMTYRRQKEVWLVSFNPTDDVVAPSIVDVQSVPLHDLR